jgi:hypothetical protein
VFVADSLCCIRKKSRLDRFSSSRSPDRAVQLITPNNVPKTPTQPKRQKLPTKPNQQEWQPRPHRHAAQSKLWYRKQAVANDTMADNTALRQQFINLVIDPDTGASLDFRHLIKGPEAGKGNKQIPATELSARTPSSSYTRQHYLMGANQAYRPQKRKSVMNPICITSLAIESITPVKQPRQVPK